MEVMMAKSEYGSYMKVYDFMIKDLGLAKYELLIYAYIFSFTASGKQFTGSIAHLSDRFGIKSNKTTSEVLKHLCEWGLINKIRTTLYNNRDGSIKGTVCIYEAVLPVPNRKLEL